MPEQTDANQTWASRDLAHIWHPCTQMKDHEWLPMIPIRRGKGVWLEDFSGQRYLDATSSWWVNLFGHCNPEINAAIQQQLETLEHCIFAGFTHPAAIELSERLVKLTPAGLEKVFFADNGSSAVEVALKMSFHYWHNQQRPKKTRFITLENSYHGETLGALAVGSVELYKKTYGPLLLEVITVASPDCFQREDGESCQQYSARMIAPMRKTLEQNAEEVCAVIIEPLVQCAGNMRMYDPVYLSELRKLCDEFDVHLIADEVAVGFGRTGTMFACEQADISPDFMCLSKGLTAGYMPLSVTLTREKIYDAFYDDYENLTAFLHSHSYTGNALACRTALATLDIFEQQPVLENNRKLAATMADACSIFQEHPHISDIRQTGMIMALEMSPDKTRQAAYPWQQRRGLKVYQHGLSQGMLLRPLGNVVYFMPPYVISEDEIRQMVEVAHQGIDIATRD
ncbi:MAG: adenosylmethionine--8-amino-7-oxononanoate transaminase [Gammaproteobacteria bacterium]